MKALILAISGKGSKQLSSERATSGPVNSLSRQVPAFLVAGASGYIISTSLTIFFTQWFGWTPFLAWFPAIGIAIFCTWLMNRTWTFKSRDKGRATEFTRYAVVSVFSAGINYLVYAGALLVRAQAGFDVRAGLVIALASAFGSGVAALVTFVLSRKYAFRSAGRSG